MALNTQGHYFLKPGKDVNTLPLASSKREIGEKLQAVGLDRKWFRRSKYNPKKVHLLESLINHAKSQGAKVP